ncbi:unnamed protein product [Arabidopsis halleri]
MKHEEAIGNRRRMHSQGRTFFINETKRYSDSKSFYGLFYVRLIYRF